MESRRACVPKQDLVQGAIQDSTYLTVGADASFMNK